MKRIYFDYNDELYDNHFQIVKRTMEDIIKNGGLAIGEKALFIDPQIDWRDENEGCLYWDGSQLVIKLG